MNNIEILTSPTNEQTDQPAYWPFPYMCVTVCRSICTVFSLKWGKVACRSLDHFLPRTARQSKFYWCSPLECINSSWLLQSYNAPFVLDTVWYKGPSTWPTTDRLWVLPPSVCLFSVNTIQQTRCMPSCKMGTWPRLGMDKTGCALSHLRYRRDFGCPHQKVVPWAVPYQHHHWLWGLLPRTGKQFPCMALTGLGLSHLGRKGRHVISNCSLLPMFDSLWGSNIQGVQKTQMHIWVNAHVWLVSLRPLQNSHNKNVKTNTNQPTSLEAYGNRTKLVSTPHTLYIYYLPGLIQPRHSQKHNSQLPHKMMWNLHQPTTSFTDWLRCSKVHSHKM